MCVVSLLRTFSSTMVMSPLDIFIIPQGETLLDAQTSTGPCSSCLR